MPTVVNLYGFRFFFYSNEGEEPPHIHVRRQGRETKFWLIGPEAAWNHGFNATEMTHIKSIVVEHRELFGRAWRQHFGH